MTATSHSWARRSLNQDERRWIQDGVAQGVVALDETGLARTFAPAAPAVPDGGSAYEVLLSWKAAKCEADDLARLLEHGDAQLVALESLGVTVVEVGVHDQVLAAEIARDMTILAEGHAPREVLDRNLGCFGRELQARTDEAIEGWMLALQTVLWMAVIEDRRDVAHVLDLMALCASAVPTQFQTRKPGHMKEAQRFLNTLRLAEIKLEAQPRTSKRGKPLSVWRAAAEFAHLFGIRTMPRRKKDAQRKTARRTP